MKKRFLAPKCRAEAWKRDF